MRPLSISAGTAVMLGRPAQPMAQALSASIAQLVRGIAGIREAYLPHCFIKGVVEPPTQVLVVVLYKFVLNFLMTLLVLLSETSRDLFVKVIFLLLWNGKEKLVD